MDDLDQLTNEDLKTLFNECSESIKDLENVSDEYKLYMTIFSEGMKHMQEIIKKQNKEINQLKKNQNSIVLSEKVLFKKPTKFSKALALLAPGRLIEIKKCDGTWCKISTLKYSGWVTKKDLWGLKKF